MNFLVVKEESRRQPSSRPATPVLVANPPVAKVASAASNRRWSERHRFDKPGVLNGQGVVEPMQCLVRNLSKFGALIDLCGASEASVPDCFELTFYNTRTRSDVSCVVRWRNRNRVGVQFASATRLSVDRRRNER